MSLAPEELSCTSNNPFSAGSTENAPGRDAVDYVANGRCEEHGGRGLVSNSDEEAGVVMATERVHETAVLEQRAPAVVLETAQFTSVISPPPVEQLMMPQASCVHALPANAYS